MIRIFLVACIILAASEFSTSTPLLPKSNSHHHATTTTTNNNNNNHNNSNEKRKIGIMTEIDTKAAHDEIRSAFDEWTDAWNAQNIDGYLEGYADIPSVRYVSGSTNTVTRGKENIVKLFQKRGARGLLTLMHFESDVVSEMDAMCFGQYRLQQQQVESKSNNNCSSKKEEGEDCQEEGGGVEQVHEGCFTVHVRKMKGCWKIVSDHSS